MQKIKLTESQLNELVTESVKRIVNEINSNTIYDAADKSDDKLRDIEKSLDYLHNSIGCLERALSKDYNFPNVDDDNQSQGAAIYRKLKSLENEFFAYFQRKKEQASNFDDEANKLYNAGIEYQD